MSIWVALILKRDTEALNGEHADIVFTEAEYRVDAAKEIQNYKWPEPWGKKGVSKCIIVKMFKLSETPLKLMMGGLQEKEKLYQDLQVLCSTSSRKTPESDHEKTNLRVRRKRR